MSIVEDEIVGQNRPKKGVGDVYNIYSFVYHKAETKYRGKPRWSFRFV